MATNREEDGPIMLRSLAFAKRTVRVEKKILAADIGLTAYDVAEAIRQWVQNNYDLQATDTIKVVGGAGPASVEVTRDGEK